MWTKLFGSASRLVQRFTSDCASLLFHFFCFFNLIHDPWEIEFGWTFCISIFKEKLINPSDQVEFWSENFAWLNNAFIQLLVDISLLFCNIHMLHFEGFDIFLCRICQLILFIGLSIFFFLILFLIFEISLAFRFIAKLIFLLSCCC